MRLSGRTQPLSPAPIESCLQIIKDVGFDGAELCLENEDVCPRLLTDDIVKRVRDRVESLGLGPLAISYHKDYVHDPAMLDATQVAIKRVRGFGSRILIICGAFRRSGDEAEWQAMVRTTRELCALAEDQGILLALEFEPNFVVDSTERLLRLFNEVGSSALVANLDIGHAFLNDPDPVQSIRTLGRRIAHCHVEGMPRGVHRHVPPDQGDLDLGPCMKALRQIDFTGGMALDLYKVDYAAVSPPAIAYLRKLIAAD